MQESLIAFLDESGGHGFNFGNVGTSTHFVVSAVIVDSKALDEITAKFNEIKSNHSPINELKSSKIGNREQLRLKLLSQINVLDFKFYSLVVDKTKIHTTSGLQYKESFYKFLYGILYHNLYRHFKYLSIIADELISQEFVSSFERYINDNHKADLFHQTNISFTKSNQTLLLQLTDLIGGTINRYHAGKSPINIQEVLPGKSIGTLIWPNSFGDYTVNENIEPDEFEKEISEISLLRVDDYIIKNQDSNDTIIKHRVRFLSYLRSVFLFNSRSAYIYTQEIVSHLNNFSSEDIKDQYLRQQIVGPLRSEGILIASNSNGYKIPSTKRDIITFFNLFSRIISPMIGRLNKTHKALFTATRGQLNMLDYPEFEYLKKILGENDDTAN